MKLENSTQRIIRLNDYGCLMRNNVGALFDNRGRLVRYGLANESKKDNKYYKSSDLIGPTPIIIQQQHVGLTLGVFTAIETKRPGWTYKSGEHEEAQLKFITHMRQLGCFAGFAQSLEDYKRIIGVI